jgi:KDEL-tailed cysteine endopeptidase
VAKQPISVAVSHTANAFRFYRSGVISSGCGTYRTHAILLIGYGKDATTGMDYWLAKNSWGTGWGEQGFVRIQRTMSYNVGVCGILSMSSYPKLA